MNLEAALRLEISVKRSAAWRRGAAVSVCVCEAARLLSSLMMWNS